MTNYEKIKTLNTDDMSEFLMSWAMKLFTGNAPMNVKTWLNNEADENEWRGDLNND